MKCRGRSFRALINLQTQVNNLTQRVERFFVSCFCVVLANLRVKLRVEKIKNSTSPEISQLTSQGVESKFEFWSNTLTDENKIAVFSLYRSAVKLKYFVTHQSAVSILVFCLRWFDGCILQKFANGASSYYSMLSMCGNLIYFKNLLTAILVAYLWFHILFRLYVSPVRFYYSFATHFATKCFCAFACVCCCWIQIMVHHKCEVMVDVSCFGCVCFEVALNVSEICGFYKACRWRRLTFFDFAECGTPFVRSFHKCLSTLRRSMTKKRKLAATIRNSSGLRDTS